MANQPNLIMVTTTNQPKPLAVDLPIAASPTQSARVPLPSNSMDEQEEVDRRQCMPGFKRSAIEHPSVALLEDDEVPTISIPKADEAVEVDEVAVAQPTKK